ncbi:adenosine-3'(2'),5'-bisphosphate nucleotidase [Campylobacter vicugnae]|uniref:3'(2'),5-bisphosphonucleoside 3'(2')-phosphohydrolase n=1 Tax=Campylobacter vicugnae TaxID=1660076 RepID=A0A1X9T3M4_9BACT|nr:3'(2'),5'-bisphosphate nucleotidase CysQ [Campylobacter sp. RM8964]ARR03088.1 adenosine-3'(2'),5'-bisphosphate nucleotidase [Campylobacter sp. RM8964]
MLDQHLNLSNLHDIAIIAARAAGRAILDVYDKFELSFKDDSSPLTTADLAANEAIINHLKPTKIPICSEESILEFNKRDENSTFWLVDPLDGTKEFVSKSGQFCVSIALIQNSRPILGVIYSPLSDDMYSSYIGSNIYKNGQTLEQSFCKSLLIVGNSQHQKEIDKFANQFNLNILKLSSAIKFGYLIEGKASLFVRFYGSSLWDTAAGDFLLHQSGGIMLSLKDLKPLNYGKKNTLNDNFIALNKFEKINLKRYLDYIK